MPETSDFRAMPLHPLSLFAYPFRIFFLSLATFGALAVPLWMAVIAGHLQLPLALPAMTWHQHEMLFAWFQAGIAGFLLTAVCVWTGTERTHGAALFALWAVWLSGRVLMAGGGELPWLLVLTVNLAFLPLVMLDVGWRVWRARQPRQLVILAVLLALWLMQLGFLLQPHGPYAAGALLVASALMLVIGGRITPNFSLGWLRRHGRNVDDIRTVPAIEIAMLAGLLLTLGATLAGGQILMAVAAALTACVIVIRMLLWRGWRVASEPLLWILHLSLLWIPVGLILLAGSVFDLWPRTAWMHAIGAGAMGALMLGVMARVALGHTGRELTLPRGMATAFVLIHGGAAARVAAALGVVSWTMGVWISAALWTIAYGVFVYRYTRILASPRIDGRPG